MPSVSEKLISESLVCCDKPAGLPTHKVDTNYPGYIEWLEQQRQQKLFCCHRLDKGTSGALLVATSAEMAAQITQAFEQQTVDKNYIFISDKAPKQNNWIYQSHIEFKNKSWVSHLQRPANSSTEFTLLNQRDGFYTILAKPMSGKTHQIRLHAQDCGIAVLGDELYGGTPHARIYLHCQSLSINSLNLEYKTKLPIMFEDLSLLKSANLCSWLNSYERRQKLYPQYLTAQQTLRLIHNEGTPLRVDKLGDVLHMGWWQDEIPTEAEYQDIKTWLSLTGYSKWLLRHYPRQAQNRTILLQSENLPDKWVAQENNINFEFKNDQGLSPGLFLDQRQHRQWIQDSSNNKNVLNLFCYTGGFSLAAALGKAQSVTSVDLSASYIQWSKNNFRLNQLDDESDKYKFYSMDSFEFLKYAQKKGLTFDIIICDPPSFSRSKKSVFRVDKDYGKLLESCLKVLNPDGFIFFSSNYEDWDTACWQKNMTKTLMPNGYHSVVLPSWQLDFEVDPRQSLLKAFHIKN